MWDLPGSGIDVSPALVGGFFPTATREALVFLLKWRHLSLFSEVSDNIFVVLVISSLWQTAQQMVMRADSGVRDPSANPTSATHICVTFGE